MRHYIPIKTYHILNNDADEWYTYFIYITTQSSANGGTFIHYCDLPSLSSNPHQAPIPSNTSTSKIPPRIPPALSSHLWPVMVVYCEIWNHTYHKSVNLRWKNFRLEMFVGSTSYENILTQIFDNMAFVRYYYSAISFCATRAHKERQTRAGVVKQRPDQPF